LKINIQLPRTCSHAFRPPSGGGLLLLLVGGTGGPLTSSSLLPLALASALTPGLLVLWLSLEVTCFSGSRLELIVLALVYKRYGFF
jgi:hypothetical protein